MSDIQTPLDNSATDSVASNPVAPPAPAGDTQGSTPAPADTAASETAKPEANEAEQQSRRASREFATQRRENRELHRQIGRLEQMIEGLRPQSAPAEGDAPPPQRQTKSPSPAAEAYDEHNRSVMESIADKGAEYEAAVDKIASNGFPMTRAMRDFLVTSDKAAEVAKLLADNPKEAMQISLLGDRAADRAMERLEARASAKPAPKTTNAPPIGPTVGGRSTAPFDPETADMDAYAPHWHARQAKKRP